MYNLNINFRFSSWVVFIILNYYKEITPKQLIGQIAGNVLFLYNHMPPGRRGEALKCHHQAF